MAISRSKVHIAPMETFPQFEAKAMTSGRWFVSVLTGHGPFARRGLRNRRRRQELDFDQIEVLAGQTGYTAMTGRDKWTVDLQCPSCGRIDVARLSQADSYDLKRGDTAIRADHVPNGFICIDPEANNFQCSKCQVSIP
jgi:hypothetical protein